MGSHAVLGAVLTVAALLLFTTVRAWAQIDLTGWATPRVEGHRQLTAGAGGL
jgi:hypothetical protein